MIDTLQRQVDGIHRRTAKMISKLQDQVSSLQKSNSQLRDGSTKLQHEVSSIRDSNNKLRDNNTQLQQKVSSTRNINKQLQQQVSSVRNNNTQLQKQVSSIRNSNKQLQQEVSSLRGSVSKLQHEYASLRGSHKKITPNISNVETKVPQCKHIEVIIVIIFIVIVNVLFKHVIVVRCYVCIALLGKSHLIATEKGSVLNCYPARHVWVLLLNAAVCWQKCVWMRKEYDSIIGCAISWMWRLLCLSLICSSY